MYVQQQFYSNIYFILNQSKFKLAGKVLSETVSSTAPQLCKMFFNVFRSKLYTFTSRTPMEYCVLHFILFYVFFSIFDYF